MSTNAQRKTRAYQDGYLHGQGGEDTRQKYINNKSYVYGNNVDTYDLGVKEGAQELAEDQERETAYHENPYRKLQKRLASVLEETDNDREQSALHEVADILDDLLTKLTDVSEGLDQL